MRRMYLHPGEYRKVLLAKYLCIGFVPGDSVPAISPLQFLITPQQFPITPQQFPITPRLHLHLLIFSDLITKNYTYTYTFQFF